MMNRFRTDDEGSVLLEGTIVLPVLLLLIVGVLEFSYYFYQQHQVATGVRDAARYLARVPDPTASAAQTTAQNIAATGAADGSLPRRVTGFDPNEVTVSVTTVANPAGLNGTRPYRQDPDPAHADEIRIVNVTGTFTWAPHPMWGFLRFGTKNITVRHSERFIGRG